MPTKKATRPHPSRLLKLALAMSLDGPASGPDRQRLNFTEHRVLVALIAYADKDGKAFPSIPLLAELAGCPSRPQRVRDALKQLGRLGYHKRIKASGRRGGRGRVRDGSERTSWQGRPRAGAEESLVARFAAQCGPGAERVARQAAATYDDLQRRATFGLAGMSRETFIKNNLQAAGYDVDRPFRGTGR